MLKRKILALAALMGLASGYAKGSRVVETVPPPMFLYYTDNDMMEVMYWTMLEKPDPEWCDDACFRRWNMQADLRRDAAQYTRLIDGDRTVGIRLVGEVLTDADGNEISLGVLHSKKNIPGAGLRYAFSGQERLNERDQYLSHFVIATDDYLSSHRQLHVWRPSFDDDEEALPDAVRRKLMMRYGRKITRSLVAARIADRYVYGVAQFEVKNHEVLAVEVLVDGDQVYDFPVKGYYDEDNGFFGWNVDDEGEYYPSGILAAFESPAGLELYYDRNAVESTEVGVMRLSDGQFSHEEIAGYYRAIDG